MDEVLRGDGMKKCNRCGVPQHPEYGFYVVSLGERDNTCRACRKDDKRGVLGVQYSALAQEERQVFCEGLLRACGFTGGRTEVLTIRMRKEGREFIYSEPPVVSN
jgi:hypothetical protein